MYTSDFKRAIIFILSIVVCFSMLFQTCEKPASPGRSPQKIQDSILFDKWKQERIEKESLIIAFEQKIGHLQRQNSDLRQSVIEQKQSREQSRKRSNQTRLRFHQAVTNLLANDGIASDSISPLLEQTELTSQQNDIACDSLVQSLETSVTVKDSIICLQETVATELKSQLQQQESVNQVLSSELDKSIKKERKKSRQVKWLGRGLILLGGVASGVFIVQKVR